MHACSSVVSSPLLAYVSVFNTNMSYVCGLLSMADVGLMENGVFQLNPSARTCTVAARVSSQFVRLVIMFPSMYPNEAVPSFQFSEESAIDTMTKNQLIQVCHHSSL